MVSGEDGKVDLLKFGTFTSARSVSRWIMRLTPELELVVMKEPFRADWGMMIQNSYLGAASSEKFWPTLEEALERTLANAGPLLERFF